MSVDNTPPLLTANEVAKILAMPLSTLKKNCSVRQEAVPPFLKLGNQRNSPIRFRRSDVEAWIQEQFEANNSTEEFESLLNKVKEDI